MPREGQDLPKGTQHAGGRTEVDTPAPVSKTTTFLPPPPSIHSETLGLGQESRGFRDVSGPVFGLRGRAQHLKNLPCLYR